MLHRHHIIPRHMGGGDSDGNYAYRTIEEHAEDHRKLYEKYGKREDYLAWKGLSGRIGKEEIIRERCAIGGTNGANTCKELKKGACYAPDPKYKKEWATKAGLVSTNKGSVWWSNGTDYKFCVEQPEGFERSTAPNNVGKSTGNTYWWNNGTSHKRSSESPGEGWLKGRINKGNLGGDRSKHG